MESVEISCFCVIVFSNQLSLMGTPFLVTPQLMSTLGPEWISFLPQLTSAALLLPLRSARRAFSSGGKDQDGNLLYLV